MLKRALRRGVPKDLRRDAWFAASGAGDLQKVGPTDGYYEKLLIMTVDQKVVDQIELTWRGRFQRITSTNEARAGETETKS